MRSPIEPPFDTCGSLAEPLADAPDLGPTRPGSVLAAGRRAFLGSVLWVSLLLPRPRVTLAQSPTATPLDVAGLASLEAVADAIVPRDKDPGALDAGVPARILAHLSAHTDALTLYRSGLALLDRVARQAGASSFGALDAHGRERVLSSLGDGRDGRPGEGERFVARVRRDVLAFYWGSELGQRVVGYRPPLSGYPEYADPPAGPRR